MEASETPSTGWSAWRHLASSMLCSRGTAPRRVVVTVWWAMAARGAGVGWAAPRCRSSVTGNLGMQWRQGTLAIPQRTPHPWRSFVLGGGSVEGTCLGCVDGWGERPSKQARACAGATRASGGRVLRPIPCCRAGRLRAQPAVALLHWRWAQGGWAARRRRPSRKRCSPSSRRSSAGRSLGCIWRAGSWPGWCGWAGRLGDCCGSARNPV